MNDTCHRGCLPHGSPGGAFQELPPLAFDYGLLLAVPPPPSPHLFARRRLSRVIFHYARLPVGVSDSSVISTWARGG